MGIQIDQVHIYASDAYAKMKKKDAVAHMLKEGFVPGKTEADKKAWAEKAYDLINPIKTGPAEEAGPSLPNGESVIARSAATKQTDWSGLGNFKTEQNK